MERNLNKMGLDFNLNETSLKLIESEYFVSMLVGWLVLLLYVPSQQLWSLRDGQFT